jgi:hypothetical protein
MPARRAKAQTRVLVAVHTHERRFTGLDVGAFVAHYMRSELVALEVEAQPLLKLAELPFASEVDSLSGARRPLTTDALTKSMDAQRRRLAARLAELARRHGIPVRSEVLQPPGWRELVRLPGADWLVMGGAAHAAGAPARAPIRRAIAVLIPEADAHSQALPVALSLADDTDADLVVLALAADRRAFERLAERLAKTLGKHAGRCAVRVEWIASLEETPGVLDRLRSRQLVAARRDVPYDAPWVERFLAKPDSVLILTPDEPAVTED